MVSEPRDRTPVLDHGYVEIVEVWGSDERIIEAARMSTDKGFHGWIRLVRCSICNREWECENKPAFCNFGMCSNRNSPTSEVHAGDAKLLRYLYEHKHMTPFEMAGMTIEVQAPIFIFREWHRHRTQSYNELSSRYTALPDTYYLPSKERIMSSRQAAANKQSSEAGILEADAISLRHRLDESYRHSRAVYENLLLCGVAREVARLVIPVAQYSRMRASANLRNWLAFLTLRMDKAAQWEIQQYANTVAAGVARHFPRTYELFAK